MDRQERLDRQERMDRQERLDRLFAEMTAYYSGDPRRVQHFVKVHGFAALIGRMEKLDPAVQEVLEAAAYVHDIGIRPAEEKYGRCDGKLQEQEGPAAAREMLKGLGFDEALVERVCWLVGHHHTYDRIDGMDYQILVEADFLVNLYESYQDRHEGRTAFGGEGKDAAASALEKIFRTGSGSRICRTMFGL